MGFIRIFPLKEVVEQSSEVFGKGEPSRCIPDSGPGSSDYFLNVMHIAAFEDIPLYLVKENNPNFLIDGIRIRLSDNSLLIFPDDSEVPEEKFVSLLQLALKGEVVEMARSVSLS